MTRTTAIHDSETCDTDNGHPCFLCRWANEQEREGLAATTTLTDDDKRVLLDAVLERVRADLNDGKPLVAGYDSDELPLDHAHTQCILAGIADDQRYASTTTIRAALFDVIDAGCPHEDGLTHEWQLDSGIEDFANEQRCDFVDAVIARIAELQRPPHGFDEHLREEQQ